MVANLNDVTGSWEMRSDGTFASLKAMGQFFGSQILYDQSQSFRKRQGACRIPAGNAG